jgi:signal transduction histidine kinase
VRTDFDDDLPAVRGDRVQLQQVILNLVLNAADAMKGIDQRPRDAVVATSRDDANHVRLSIRDTGVGIEPRNIEKLFNAFYTTKADGMGLGLSLSRSIIESHAGRLWATANDDGSDATFPFSIPCADGLNEIITTAMKMGTHAGFLGSWVGSTYSRPRGPIALT